MSEFEGKYILLDFWVVGCAACHSAMPDLKKLHEELGDELNIVGIFTGGESSWEFATETMFGSIPFTNLLLPEGSDLEERYGVTATPTYFLIAPDGKILETWKGHHWGRIERELEKYRNQ